MKARKATVPEKEELVPITRPAPQLSVVSPEDSGPVCRETACDHLAIAAGYCRAHYIKNWQTIKRKQAILKNGRLRGFIQEMINKYPDKFSSIIRHDLATDESFAHVIHELDMSEDATDLDSIEGINAREDFPAEDLPPFMKEGEGEEPGEEP